MPKTGTKKFKDKQEVEMKFKGFDSYVILEG